MLFLNTQNMQNLFFDSRTLGKLKLSVIWTSKLHHFHTFLFVSETILFNKRRDHLIGDSIVFLDKGWQIFRQVYVSENTNFCYEFVEFIWLNKNCKAMWIHLITSNMAFSQFENEPCCIKDCWGVYEQNTIVDNWTAKWAVTVGYELKRKKWSKPNESDYGNSSNCENCDCDWNLFVKYHTVFKVVVQFLFKWSNQIKISDLYIY